MGPTQSVLLLLCTVVLATSPVLAERRCQTLTVSPSDELMVIPPKVDSLNLPRAVFVPQGDPQHLGIEVPPTVIFHRYYYTGDRDFQAQMLPGGSSVIVARHPGTGEQIAIEAQLLPGAPRVYYTRREIRYVYAEKTIAVHFGIEPFTDTKVVVCDHQVTDGVKSTVRNVSTAIVGLARRTGIPHAAASVDRRAKEGVVAVADRVHDAGTVAVRPVVYLWKSTPISGLLTPSSQCGPSGSTRGIVGELDGTVPTIR